MAWVDHISYKWQNTTLLIDDSGDLDSPRMEAKSSGMGSGYSTIKLTHHSHIKPLLRSKAWKKELLINTRRDIIKELFVALL